MKSSEKVCQLFSPSQSKQGSETALQAVEQLIFCSSGDTSCADSPHHNGSASLVWESPEQVRLGHLQETSLLATPVDTVSCMFTSTGKISPSIRLQQSPILAVDSGLVSSSKPRFGPDLKLCDVTAFWQSDATDVQCTVRPENKTCIGDETSSLRQLPEIVSVGSKEILDSSDANSVIRHAKPQPVFSGESHLGSHHTADIVDHFLSGEFLDNGENKKGIDVVDSWNRKQVASVNGTCKTGSRCSSLETKQIDCHGFGSCARDCSNAMTMGDNKPDFPHKLFLEEERNSCPSSADVRPEHVIIGSSEPVKCEMISEPCEFGEVVSVGRQQAARARKQRRKSAFGAQLGLHLEAVFETSEGLGNANTDCGETEGVPAAQLNGTCSQCRGTCSHFVQQSLGGARLSDGGEVLLASEEEFTVQASAIELPALEGLTDQQKAEVKDIMDNLELDEPQQLPPLVKKRKRRMSADLSIIKSGECVGPDPSKSASASAVLDGDIGGRRSSLRLYRRQSHKFAIPSRCIAQEVDVSSAVDDSDSAATQQRRCLKNGDSIADNSLPLPQPQSETLFEDSFLDIETDEDDIPAELKNLYQNKNYLKPADKMWETIFEVPSKGKVSSKQKVKRYFLFEDNVPKAKLRRRQKKAVLNGWDAKAWMKRKMFTDLDVKRKLSSLDEEISDS